MTADQAGASYRVEKENNGHLSTLTVPGGGQHVRLGDDFGRTVYLESAGLGAEVWAYSISNS